MKPTYDQRQLDAPKITCTVCGKTAFMTHGQTICATCQSKEGWTRGS